MDAQLPAVGPHSPVAERPLAHRFDTVIAHHWRLFRATRRGCHVTVVMGFARGRGPRRAGSRLLDSQQPDESHTARFARPNACHSSAGRPGTRSRHYCAEGRALAAALTRAASRAGGRSPARSPSDHAGRPHSGCPMQDSKPPCHLLPRLCPRRPPLRRSPRGSHHLRLLPPRPPKRLRRRRPPNGRRRKLKPTTRPRASRNWSGHGPIPWRIATRFSSGAAAAGPTGSRWTSSPRPRSSSRRRGSFCLPPPARSSAHLKRKARSR